MKKILLLGAGLSSNSLIKYLLDQTEKFNWHLTVGDFDEQKARKKIGDHPHGTGVSFDVFNEDQKELLISNADIVISMLPHRLHPLLAYSCIKHRKNLITASYVSEEVRQLDTQVKKLGLLFLNEIGVDPGIDHMSAMKVINRIRKEGGILDIFESNTGGLVAPGYERNPWQYKFTWNPRNVVLAGQHGARFLHNGKFKYIPYHKIFQRYEIITVLDKGEFEVYPNRDSLQYKDDYGLDEISTMFRGTIRRPGFCDAWNTLVQLGATDDSYVVEFPGEMTYRDFTNSFLAYNIIDPVEIKLANYLNIPFDGKIMKQLEWLGLFERKTVGLNNQTPARILQHLLEEKWKLESGDKDMIVMQHQFEYLLKGKRKRIVSSLSVIGENPDETAMSMTVGLPVGIAAKLILERKIQATGVCIPTTPEFYEPILNELEDYGIKFVEESFEL
ncbi:MAG: saccharopine dehydrogenase [Bacteroides sp. SM23_62_1]|nr:MAG: saccharopine dehydrogenase [Bacteroides sp. SM23_62_1]